VEWLGWSVCDRGTAGAMSSMAGGVHQGGEREGVETRNKERVDIRLHESPAMVVAAIGKDGRERLKLETEEGNWVWLASGGGAQEGCATLCRCNAACCTYCRQSEGERVDAWGRDDTRCCRMMMGDAMLLLTRGMDSGVLLHASSAEGRR
jgi:hypothetical protein